MLIVRKLPNWQRVILAKPSHTDPGTRERSNQTIEPPGRLDADRTAMQWRGFGRNVDRVR
jgi:hypothetical protein